MFIAEVQTQRSWTKYTPDEALARGSEPEAVQRRLLTVAGAKAGRNTQIFGEYAATW